jgi:uncharacterized protein with PQ loop repeat
MAKQHRRSHHATRRQHGSHRQPFDYIIYLFTFATPLFELPQAYDIYSNHSAANVSTLTWSFFVVDNLVWIVYAARKRLWPVLISSVLYLLIESSVVVGILRYS